MSTSGDVRPLLHLSGLLGGLGIWSSGLSAGDLGTW